MQKEIYFFKNCFEHFTPTLFDELKLNPESFFVPPFFLFTSQKRLASPWYDTFQCILNTLSFRRS